MESAQLLAELKDQTKFPEELGLNLNADQSGDMSGPDSEPSSGFMLKY